MASLRLGDTAPDFTPVCITELGFTAKLKDEFAKRNEDGDDVVIVPSLQDPELIKQKFPKDFRAVTPYLRPTPQPNK